MFGGLVGFSYYSHFVLITVVWITPHPSANCPPPPRFTNDTKRESKHREWIFVVFKISLPSHRGIYSVIAGRRGCVYCTGSHGGRRLGEKMEWGGWGLEGSLRVMVSFSTSLLSVCFLCICACSLVLLVWCMHPNTVMLHLHACVHALIYRGQCIKRLSLTPSCMQLQIKETSMLITHRKLGSRARSRPRAGFSQALTCR